MKTSPLFALVLVGLSLTGCVNVQPAHVRSRAQNTATSEVDASTPQERWAKMLVDPSIEKTAKAYEKRGESPGEARAIAEIKYYLSRGR